MKPVRIGSISDIHLGVRRVPTATIIAHLMEVFVPKVAEMDVLNIGGDVFDSGQELSDASAQLSIAFIAHLLDECDKHDVVVRVIRGTFTHERTQAQLFEKLHAARGNTHSLRYFDQLAVEHIERYDLRVLYIPDDLPFPSSDAIMTAAHELIDKAGWDSVDYAFVHGSFAEALPPAAHAHVRRLFRADQFTCVRRLVLTGHLHTPQQFANVIYNGSFERIAHGEPEDKGFIFVDDPGDRGHPTAHFVVNPHTTRFDTVDLRAHGTVEDATRALQAVVDRYPNDRPAYLRVMHHDALVARALAAVVARHHPHIRYSHLLLADSAGAHAAELPLAAERPVLTPPSPETLPDLIRSFLDKNHPGHTLDLSDIRTLLAALA